MLQTEKLIILFQSKFKNRYKRYPYSLSTVRDSKWYKHFENFALTTKLEYGDEEKFLDRLFFNSEDVVWPFVLSQDRAKQIEKNILDEKTYFNSSLSEKDYIKETLKKCKTWCKSKGIKENQLYSFITDDANQLLAKRGRYYLPLFCFSKKFLENYVLSDEDRLKKNSIRAFYTELYEALKVSLKDDFIDD